MNRHVLIVDDSAVSRRYVQRILEISGFGFAAVIEARSGREAITVLQTARVDLLITDISMPEMSGDELVSWIDQNCRNLPVVIISSDSSPLRAERLTRARGFVPKPFTPEVLRAEVDRVLASCDTGDLVAELLPGCAESALETMFFTSLVRPPDRIHEIPAGYVWARARYDGTAKGFLTLGAEPMAALAIAARFLGADAVAREQVEQTLCELANVICGSALSRIEHRRNFRILPPEILQEGPSSIAFRAQESGESLLRLQCEDGEIVVGFSVDA